LLDGCDSQQSGHFSILFIACHPELTYLRFWLNRSNNKKVTKFFKIFSVSKKDEMRTFFEKINQSKKYFLKIRNHF